MYVGKSKRFRREPSRFTKPFVCVLFPRMYDTDTCDMYPGRKSLTIIIYASFTFSSQHSYLVEWLGMKYTYNIFTSRHVRAVTAY